jgi:hypothetical protein
MAKETADLVGRMTMIDAKLSAGFLADAARVSLSRQDGSELLHGKSVATSPFLLAMLGIRSPSAPRRALISSLRLSRYTRR